MKKTKYVLFNNKMRHEFFTEEALNIKFNDIILERVDCVRLLGLELDERLQFDQHIRSIQNKIIPFTFALKRIRDLISDKTALMLYNSYIQSRIMYMNCVWYAAPNFLIESLEITQRKSLRVVLKKPWHCSRSELYSNSIFSVSSLAQLSSGLLMFKMKHNLAKNLNLFRNLSQQHNFNTRNNDLIVVDRTSSQFGSKNFYI